MLKKTTLMTPGPTQVPAEVLAAEGAPIIHHRTEQFSAIFMEVIKDMQYVYETKKDVLSFTSSGTGAMEGAVSNFLSAGDTALCVRGGKFGERWTEICEAYGLKAVNYDIEWGTAPDPEHIRKLLKENPDIKAVYTTLNETSTATTYDIEAIGKVTTEMDKLYVVDAISGLGCIPMKTDDWNVDICVSGSQKGLMLPPGLAFASVSPKAWEYEAKSNLPRYYFSYKKALNSWKKETTAYTPGVSLYRGVAKALQMIREEGLENVFARHKRLAEACRAAVKALDLKFLSSRPSDCVTGLWVPESIDGGKFKKHFETAYGVAVAGGQAQLKGKIIRIAHMGYCSDADIILAISALEMSLKDFGYKMELGTGIKAAEEILAKGK